MSIYIKTTQPELERCLDSLQIQTVKPAQIVIVLDGEICDVVSRYLEELDQSIFLFVRLAENCGLGEALAIGLDHCKYSLIARMDSDDYCINSMRFETQLLMMNENKRIDVCGAGLVEVYNHKEQAVELSRKLPLRHEEIESFAKNRNPLNHQTVMYKKEEVMKAGGYLDMPYFEDYYLWARMLKTGSVFANSSINLVKTEVDDAYFKRRGGIGYAKHELNLAKALWRIKFLSGIETLVFIAKRLPLRFLPAILRKSLYAKVLRKK